MKRLATIIVLSTGLIAGPAAADHQGSSDLLSKENVGGAIGATVGGFLGSKVGDGKGRLVTTAAGAVGGFLLGENVAHNYGGKRGSKYGHHRGGRESRSYRPRVHPMKQTLVARTTSNVRAGPSTRHSITGRLHRNERVRVVGKVEGRNWYVVRDRGRQGFIYAPLLTRPYRGHDGHSWRGDHGRGDHGRDHRRRGWKR